MHFLEWECLNTIKISLKFVPKGPINNIPPLVQAPSNYLNQWLLVYRRIYVSLRLNDKKHLNFIFELIIAPRDDVWYAFQSEQEIEWHRHGVQQFNINTKVKHKR